MRRALAIGLAALTALALAGIAGAFLRASGVQEASAAFEARTVERFESRTCTGTDGDTYEIVKARFAGKAEGSDDAFSGPLVMKVKSVYNTTDGIGYMEGSIKIRRGDNGGRRGHAKFWAVREGDQVDGFVSGRANRHYAKLLGNLTATFDSGGFASGKIGDGAAGNGAALLVGHRCNGKSDDKHKEGKEEREHSDEKKAEKGEKGESHEDAKDDKHEDSEDEKHDEPEKDEHEDSHDEKS